MSRHASFRSSMQMVRIIAFHFAIEIESGCYGTVVKQEIGQQTGQQTQELNPNPYPAKLNNL